MLSYQDKYILAEALGRWTMVNGHFETKKTVF